MQIEGTKVLKNSFIRGGMTFPQNGQILMKLGAIGNIGVANSNLEVVLENFEI